MTGEVTEYRPGSILDKEPNTIAAAVFAVVNFVLALQTEWTIDSDTLLAGNVALVMVLSLFVRAKSTSNSTATVLVEAAAAESAVQAKTDIDNFLFAVSEDEKMAAADESGARYQEALAAAESEIVALRTQIVSAESAPAPVKKAAAKKAGKKK